MAHWYGGRKCTILLLSDDTRIQGLAGMNYYEVTDVMIDVSAELT